MHVPAVAEVNPPIVTEIDGLEATSSLVPA